MALKPWKRNKSIVQVAILFHNDQFLLSTMVYIAFSQDIHLSNPAPIDQIPTIDLNQLFIRLCVFVPSERLKQSLLVCEVVACFRIR